LAFFTPVERSTVHLPTLGQPKAKPKPNQTKPGWAAAAAPAAAAADDIEPTNQILVTYLLFRSNKQNKQTNQPKTNQPTNQPLFHPPLKTNKKTHHKQKQNKGKTKGLFKVQTTKTKNPSLASYKSLPKKTKQNKTKQNKITKYNPTPHTLTQLHHPPPFGPFLFASFDF